MYKQHKQVIYANPDSAYQRFVNAVKLKNPVDSDKRVTGEANKLWKEFKKDSKKACNFLCFMNYYFSNFFCKYDIITRIYLDWFWTHIFYE